VHHEIGLISTIAVGLVYALVGGYVAKRVGLPPLVGYLLAGAQSDRLHRALLLTLSWPHNWPRSA
jgi:predicted Kef-type K+ transport protein